MNNQRFGTIIKDAQSLARQFGKIDPKPWPAEVKVADLQIKVGSVAQAVLKRQGFKASGKTADKLAKDLATIFFILLDLADVYKIDFEQAFASFLAVTKKELESHQQST